MAGQEAIEPCEAFDEMLRLHADPDTNVVFDAEPASGDHEDAFLFPQNLGELFGRHVEIIVQEGHSTGSGTLPGPAVALLDPAPDDVRILAKQCPAPCQDALAVLLLHDGCTKNLAQD